MEQEASHETVVTVMANHCFPMRSKTGGCDGSSARPSRHQVRNTTLTAMELMRSGFPTTCQRCGTCFGFDVDAMDARPPVRMVKVFDSRDLEQGANAADLPSGTSSADDRERDGDEDEEEEHDDGEDAGKDAPRVQTSDEDGTRNMEDGTRNMEDGTRNDEGDHTTESDRQAEATGSDVVRSILDAVGYAALLCEYASGFFWIPSDDQWFSVRDLCPPDKRSVHSDDDGDDDAVQDDADEDNITDDDEDADSRLMRILTETVSRRLATDDARETDGGSGDDALADDDARETDEGSREGTFAPPFGAHRTLDAERTLYYCQRCFARNSLKARGVERCMACGTFNNCRGAKVDGRSGGRPGDVIRGTIEIGEFVVLEPLELRPHVSNKSSICRPCISAFVAQGKLAGKDPLPDSKGDDDEEQSDEDSHDETNRDDDGVEDREEDDTTEEPDIRKPNKVSRRVRFRTPPPGAPPSTPEHSDAEDPQDDRKPASWKNIKTVTRKITEDAAGL